MNEQETADRNHIRGRSSLIELWCSRMEKRSNRHAECHHARAVYRRMSPFPCAGLA